MIKRTLYFGNPAYLSLKDAQLIVRLPEAVHLTSNSTLKGEVETNEAFEKFKKEAAASISIEDIGLVVLDHKQTTITQAVTGSMLFINKSKIRFESKSKPS